MNEDLFKYPSSNQVIHYGLGSWDSSKLRFLCSMSRIGYIKRAVGSLIFMDLMCIHRPCCLYLKAGGPVE